MDLGLHIDPVESYRRFQAMIMEQYEHLTPEFGLTVMDATKPVEVQQRLLRKTMAPHLKGLYRRTRPYAQV